MRKLLILLLFIIPVLASAQDAGRYIINPQSGQFDYISRIFPGHDTLINFGTNNTFSSGSLNGVIGHNNTVTADQGISIGYQNFLTHEGNYQFGAFITDDTSNTITIGRGWNAFQPLVNSKYGTVGLGYFSSKPVLYVQSGLEPGETWTQDIGGVSIGGPDLDTLTALQITAHESDGSSFIIKGEDSNRVERFSIDDMGNMSISGTITVDSIVSQRVPTIYQVAGDTTGSAPAKIGDIFINTLSGDSYMSTGTARGDWVKLNFLLPLILVRIRKRSLLLLIASMMIIPAFSQEPGRLLVNPITGHLEYSSNIYWMSDTLINFGNHNQFTPGLICGVIGNDNHVNAQEGEFVIGNNNSTGCNEEFLFGSWMECFANGSMSISSGWLPKHNRFMNDCPGSIGIGILSLSPILYIDYGYYEGDSWRGDARRRLHR